MAAVRSRFQVAADGSVTGGWSFSEQGQSVMKNSGTEEDKLSGTVTNGTIGGSTSAFQLSGTLTLTTQFSVNGVTSPATTQQIQTPISLPCKLTADCSGNVGATVTVPTAGASIVLRRTRPGDATRPTGHARAAPHLVPVDARDRWRCGSRRG